MNVTADQLAVELRADMAEYERKMRSATSLADTSLNRIEGSFGRAERSVAKSSSSIGRSFDHAAQRSRLLGYQISDIGVQLSSGQSPFLVLAQQAPQVANALEGTTGVAGRMAAFFSGPWGAALLAAASVAGVLAGELLEVDEASDLAKAGADSLSSAQSALGAIFDDTSGKLRTQNELLIVNARLMAANLRADALSKRASARDTLIDAQQTSQGFQAALGTAEVRDQATRDARAVQQLLRDISSGRITRDQAIRASENLDFSGTRVSRSEFQQALVDATVANMNERVAGLIDKSLDSGQLAQELRTPSSAGSASRGKRGASSAASRVQDETAALEKRYQVTKEQLELEARLRELRDMGSDEARMEADIMESNARLARQFPELDAERLKILKDIAAATIEEAYGRKKAKEELDAWFDEVEKRQKETQEKRKEAEEDLARFQEAKVRTLGQLYYDLFNRGTESIWENFRSIGLSVIAEVLARWSLAQIAGGGGFNFGDAIGSAISATLGIPGFASGGSMRLGGRGGTDSNVLSLNGSPIARVSSGEELNITNPALGGRGGGAVVNQTFNVDARGAWMADEFGEMLLRESEKRAIRHDAKAAQLTLKAVPARMANFRKNGT